MDSETKAYLNEDHNLKQNDHQEGGLDEGPNAPGNPLAGNSVFSSTPYNNNNPLTASAFGHYHPPTQFQNYNHSTSYVSIVTNNRS